ncbi:MAG: PAS domain-containing protein [Candidatus Zixiibacteriota bacterium]
MSSVVVNQSNQQGRGIRRCAVCKIDMKGRFVYIDEAFEKLLGQTTETLFGKSILSHLDADSQELISYMLSQRNHYETFYDTCEIVIVTGAQATVPARAVITLNYINGNPVNYQLIVDALNNADDNLELPGRVSDGLLKNLLALQAESDIKDAVSFVRRCANATVALVYAVRGTTLEPRTAVSVSGSGESLFKKASALTTEHISAIGVSDLVQLPKEISPDDLSSDRELLMTLNTGAGRDYLVRLIFQGGDCRNLNSRCRTRVAQAHEYVKTVLNSQKSKDEDSGDTVDLPFTIGLLDALKIGACLIDQIGSIAGFNQSLAEMLGGAQPEGSYSDLAGILGSCNSADLADEINSFFSDSNESDGIVDFETEVYLPSGQKGRLTIIRFSTSPSDLQACLAIVPYPTFSADSGLAVTASRAVEHAIAPVS